MDVFCHPIQKRYLRISDPNESANGPNGMDNDGKNELGCNPVHENCYKIGYYAFILAKECQKRIFSSSLHVHFVIQH